jgi:predicted Zn-dependent protease
MATKLERIQAACAADPKNPFGWYSLAMEQKKTDPAAALRIFERVRAEHPGYVPNYYHYAQTLEQTGDISRAEDVYREGLTAAAKAGDGHAAGELEAQLERLAAER